MGDKMVLANQVLAINRIRPMEAFELLTWHGCLELASEFSRQISGDVSLAVLCNWLREQGEGWLALFTAPKEVDK